MKLLNWNTEWLSPRSRKGRFEAARELIADYDPDVVCLTEANPETMPDGGQTITSERSGAGNMENRGARKVVLWSRTGWTDVESLGSPRLPEGRFVSGKTTVDDQEWTIVGMCIPYHGYRNNQRWGEKRMRNWQGAREYLDALREVVLPDPKSNERTVLPGDFNLQIPPFGYPQKDGEVDQKRKQTFDDWLIPTSGLGRHFIDHVAMSTDLRVESMRFISKVAADGQKLSDHNGVFIEVVSA